MLLNKYEQDYKNYLATEKRYNELWQELRQERNWVPLPQPVQRGWIVSFVLRDDIKNRADADAIQKALDLCQYSFKTRNVKLVKEIRRFKSFRDLIHRSDFRWKYANRPSLALIGERDFKNLTPNVSKFFELDPENERWKSFRGSKYYLCIPHFWLELKARPNMVTHILEKGGEKETECEFLRDKLRLYWIRYGHNMRGSHLTHKDRARTRDNIQKFKKGEIDDIINEKIPKEYD